MSTFDLFKIFEQSKNISDTVNIPKPAMNKENYLCEHLEVSEEHGAILCVDCGQEIKRELNFDKEWRYYGADDTRKNSDPSRCQIRKIEDRSIFKDVENMGFSEKVVQLANDIYTQITKGKIYRGNSRKSIVFACIFHAHKLSNKPQSCDQLQLIFNLEKKTVLKGLKFVSLNVPKDSHIRTKHITPVDLISEIMVTLKLEDYDIKQVIEIYNQIKNRSSVLNRSRPQSLASGLIYYWIILNNKDINLKDFIRMVKLSELTISKISKEICKILNI